MLASALQVLAVAAVLPLPSDTPPARRVPPPPARELRAINDVVLSARMANGAPAPSTIILPQLRNRADVISYIQRNYPDSASASVVPVTWVYIDEGGAPHLPEILVSSGSPKLDALAVEAVKRAQFAPAHVEKKEVPVWVMLPVQVNGLASLPAPIPSPGEGPRFTPYTQKPELRNRDVVVRALVSNYPADLKAKKVGGTTLVWVYVDELGNVGNVRVRESSGYTELDDAAVRVARVMSFTPALNRDRVVPVWIMLPIVFRAP